MAKKNKTKEKVSDKGEVASISPDRDWESESHARTVMEAHEIMNDPDKMKAVHKHLKKKKKAMKSVDDLIKFRNDKYGAKAPTDNDGDED